MKTRDIQRQETLEAGIVGSRRYGRYRGAQGGCNEVRSTCCEGKQSKSGLKYSSRSHFFRAATVDLGCFFLTYPDTPLSTTVIDPSDYSAHYYYYCGGRLNLRSGLNLQ